MNDVADKPDAAASASASRARSNPFLALSKGILLAAYTLYCYLAYAFLRMLASSPEAKTATAVRREHLWLKGCARLAGFDVTVRGDVPEGGYLIAPNHLGYADIVAVGSVFECFFVAKADVESWPVIGFLFKQSEQIGVPRDSRRGVLGANDRVRDRLERGLPVCVFLEGTSSGGDDVLPFHASLLQPALDAGVPAVPVGIRWSCDKPGADVAEDIAYWKDHVLVPHLFRLLGLGRCRVEIVIGEPVEAGAMDRKAWAADLRERVVALRGEAP